MSSFLLLCFLVYNWMNRYYCKSKNTRFVFHGIQQKYCFLHLFFQKLQVCSFYRWSQLKMRKSPKSICSISSCQKRQKTCYSNVITVQFRPFWDSSTCILEAVFTEPLNIDCIHSNSINSHFLILINLLNLGIPRDPRGNKFLILKFNFFILQVFQ